MKKSRIILLAALLIITSLCAFREWQIQASSVSRGGIGPDVIVGDIPGVRRWGSDGGFTSFSIATTSCNIGDTRLDWISSTTIHPVISQNLYRISQNDGRIEQLGMSWLKHGFAVAAGNNCNTCTDFSSSYLAVGCSDPYGSSLNGSQGLLGPRSEVNATTGVFIMPHGDLPETDVLDGRIRVDNDDLILAQNVGAKYFVESMYVHPQDAQSGNGLNNASYREVFPTQSGSNVGFDVGGPPTVREEPAINAWQAVNPDVQLFEADIPGDGRVIVGVLTVTDAGGTHTEIAIENLNSHQSVRSISVTYGPGVISNPGFNDVDYQYEPYSGTDWAPVITGNEIEWATETFAQNADANALRWNTLYSYWCDADSCPTKIKLGLFRSGATSEYEIDLSQPVAAEGRKLLDGVEAAGSLADTGASDNVYYGLDPSPTKNLVKQKIDLVLQSTSPVSNPAGLAFRLEAAMTGGPVGDVKQSIELYDHVAGDYELIDVRNAASIDNWVEIPVTDPARFIQPITNEITAKIVWKSTSFAGTPFTWSVDVDEAVWAFVD